jgi:deazaflavin-dependent oxidoreductase (nitroreductase family)
VDEGGDDLPVFHVRERTGGRYGSEIDEAFCYITTKGRRTGRPHRIEIWFAAAPDGRTIYMLSYGTADWVRNVLADPNVTVRIGDEEGPATGRVVAAGSDEEAVARRLVLAKYQQPGSGDLEGWSRSALPVALDLTF